MCIRDSNRVVDHPIMLTSSYSLSPSPSSYSSSPSSSGLIKTIKILIWAHSERKSNGYTVKVVLILCTTNVERSNVEQHSKYIKSKQLLPYTD